jgi:cyclopropane fatty-acyl-phospholipid synthase-like methyltransferase
MMFYLETDHPVALDSPDHIDPRCTKFDNTTHPPFNRWLFELYGFKRPAVLDFGCSGGGLVKSLIHDGCVSVGLEGSDYSKLRKRPHWDTCPNLFTADVTKPFTVHTGDGEPYKFDCVTAWEFFEHIATEDLSGVINNINRHLSRAGFLLCSITSKGSLHGKLQHHLTRQPRDWWIEMFSDNGYQHDQALYEYFDNFWVRQGTFKLALRRKA